MKPALLILISAVAAAGCDMTAYKPQDGLKAEPRGDGVVFTWNGERNQELRAWFSIENQKPVVKELAVRKSSGSWVVLGHDLIPEYEVTSGRRRISEQQMKPLRDLGIAITPEVVEREKWNAFWDAPLMVPGAKGTNLDLPRQASEIKRSWSSYEASNCAVSTIGARLEITFNGLRLGIFNGHLRFTAYRGTNLLRQEAIAATEEQSVAYKYVAGLKGFDIQPDTKVVWQDTARTWQQYRFGGAVNVDPVALRARNRLGIIERNGGSLAFLPPSHKFFFAREIETNLGFVYYRKDGANSFAVGARQADREEPYRPYGVSDQLWQTRQNEARHDINNFALYNAPPGTLQHMPVYFYLTAEDSRATQQAVLEFTHDDRYKEVPGFKVLTSHFHMHFNEQLSDAGTLDAQPSWLQVFRGLGINIAILADFHGDSHLNDTGPLRFAEQKVYFEGCQRFSDKDFLLIPGEEPDNTFGGHYISFMSKPVYWSHVRTEGQKFIDKDPKYGNVYHIGSATEELEMLKREGGLAWQAHPRTKGSTGYPDAVKDKVPFLSEQFLGGSYQSLPVDQSEARICEKRCLGLMDEMNNWGTAKYLIAEGDTYMKYPDDETFPQLIVNYVKLNEVPAYNQSWTPIAKAMRNGDYFVSTGEVLLPKWGITDGKAGEKIFMADVEYTFPLEFVELVWGSGGGTQRKMILATDLPPKSHHTFQLPFNTAGVKWVRFAAWDSAGNGAFTQPVHFK